MLASTLIRFLAVFTALQASQALAIPLAQTFEDGTTQGWIAGGGPGGGVPPNAPVNIATGGPAGADDNFLQISGTGVPNAPGGRLVANNFSQWGGDYTGLQITSITMDVRNLGTSDLYLRLLLENPLGGPPTDIATTAAVFLPAAGDWQSVSFGVTAGDLTALLGNPIQLLQNVTGVRIFSSQSAQFPPDALPGVLGVDNIAVEASGVVPEPSSVVLTGLALAALVLRRRRSL